MLIKEVPPPKNPVAVPQKTDWIRLEREFQIKVLDEYKWFLSVYGDGLFCHYFYFFNPHPLAKFIFSPSFIDEKFSYLEKGFRAFDKNVKLFPDPKGLIPFANSMDGPMLYWQPASMDKKTVASDFMFLEEHRGSFLVFLHSFVMGKTDSKILPKITKSRRKFQPWNIEPWGKNP